MKYFATILFLGLMCSAATAQDGPYPQTKDAAGHPQLKGILETDFTKLVLGCIPGQSKYAHLTLQKKGAFGSSTTKELSAIPGDILSGVPTDSYVKQPTAASLGAIFNYIFTDTDKNADSESTDKADRLLNFSLPQNLSSLIDTRYSGTIYGQTCASSIAGKLEVSGGYSLPVADVQASINATAASSKTYSLDLVDGTYVSPLPDLLNDLEPGIAPYPQLVLWKWYRDEFNSGHPEVVTANSWLLRRMRGISVYQVYGDKQNFTAHADASASLNVVFLKASSSVSGDVATSVNTQINVFQVMPYIDPKTGLGDKDWSLLPSPAKLTSNRFTIQLQETAANSIVQPNSTHTEHYIATGIPREVCTKPLWDVYSPTGTSVAGLTLTGVSVDPTAKSTDASITCIFETRYQVPGSVPATGLPLAYQFAMTINASQAATGSNAFVLSTPGTTLTTADGPNLSVGLMNEKFTASAFGSGSSQLDWKLLLQVAETPSSQIAAGSTVTIANLMLTCGNSSANGIIPTPAAVTPSVVAGTKQLQFTVSQVVLDTEVNSAATSGLVKCHLNGTATFSLAAGGTVSRPLATGSGIELLYPPPPVPGAPTGLTVSTSANQANLSWTPVVNATSYSIYRSTASGARTGAPYKTGLTAPTFNDTGLPTGFQFYYIVVAVNASGEGTSSVEIVAH